MRGKGMVLGFAHLHMKVLNKCSPSQNSARGELDSPKQCICVSIRGFLSSSKERKTQGMLCKSCIIVIPHNFTSLSPFAVFLKTSAFRAK